MDPATRKRGQGPIVAGMVAVAVAAILGRLGLDFFSGVALGIALASFFLGFREFNRNR